MFSLMEECSCAFEDLTNRIKKIEGIGKPVRDDNLCLIYFEALNKFKDIIAAKGANDSDK